MFTVACNELCEILHENRLRDDLFFSIDSNSVGLVLWRPTANHLHIALRDLIQEVSYAKTESTNGKMRLIRQVLSLQIGWAVSNHNFYGVDVLHKAQRRSFSYENVM